MCWLRLRVMLGMALSVNRSRLIGRYVIGGHKYDNFLTVVVIAGAVTGPARSGRWN